MTRKNQTELLEITIHNFKYKNKSINSIQTGQVELKIKLVNLKILNIPEL